MARDDAHGILLSLFANLLDEDRLGLLGGQAADTLERGKLLVLDAREFGSLLVEFLLTHEQLAITFLKHVGAMVKLLVALQQAALEVLKVDTLGATFLVELALDLDLLLLGLEDEFLLLGSRFGHDALGLVVGGLDGLIGDHAAREESDEEPADSRQYDDDRHDDGFVHFSLPSGHRAGGNSTSLGTPPLVAERRYSHWCRSTSRVKEEA